MGYGRCAVPSCFNRPGNDVLFKYLPKNQSQRQSWLSTLPSWMTGVLEIDKENASRRIAFCEVLNVNIKRWT